MRIRPTDLNTMRAIHPAYAEALVKLKEFIPDGNEYCPSVFNGTTDQLPKDYDYDPSNTRQQAGLTTAHSKLPLTRIEHVEMPPSIISNMPTLPQTAIDFEALRLNRQLFPEKNDALIHPTYTVEVKRIPPHNKN